MPRLRSLYRRLRVATKAQRLPREQWRALVRQFIEEDLEQMETLRGG